MFKLSKAVLINLGVICASVGIGLIIRNYIFQSNLESKPPVILRVEKPLGYYNSDSKCVESKSSESREPVCETSFYLIQSRTQFLIKAKMATNSKEEEIPRLLAAQLKIHLEFRKILKNESKADSYIQRIENSILYRYLENDFVKKTIFWLGIGEQLKGNNWLKYVESKEQYIQLLVKITEEAKSIPPNLLK